MKQGLIKTVERSFSDILSIIPVNHQPAQLESWERLIAQQAAASLDRRYVFLSRYQIESFFAEKLRRGGSHSQTMSQADDVSSGPSHINQNVSSLDVWPLGLQIGLADAKQRARLKRELGAITIGTVFGGISGLPRLYQSIVRGFSLATDYDQLPTRKECIASTNYKESDGAEPERWSIPAFIVGVLLFLAGNLFTHYGAERFEDCGLVRRRWHEYDLLILGFLCLLGGLVLMFIIPFLI
ncbi:hypothetical protein [Candidatus Binatus sp.]|uniref:hypothetical protein n=1 Tax=Candidatus Binatus sp. TaxID=2811406 RepID=UPI003C48EBD3